MRSFTSRSLCCSRRARSCARREVPGSTPGDRPPSVHRRTAHRTHTNSRRGLRTEGQRFQSSRARYKTAPGEFFAGWARGRGSLRCVTFVTFTQHFAWRRSNPCSTCCTDVTPGTLPSIASRRRALRSHLRKPSGRPLICGHACAVRHGLICGAVDEHQRRSGRREIVATGKRQLVPRKRHGGANAVVTATTVRCHAERCRRAE